MNGSSRPSDRDERVAAQGRRDPYTDEIDAMDGCKVYRSDDGAEISIIARWDHVEANCHGPVEHFRDDGGCEHMDELLSVQKPGRDVRVLPFGGRRAA